MLLLAATTRVDLVDEDYQIPPGDWKWVEVDLRQQPAVVLANYIVQGGDANGNPPGTGDPGYTIADEFPSSLSAFTADSIAMANTGAPHSASSQFFIWVGPHQLPNANYARFGQVSSGQGVVQAIETTGSPAGEVSQPVDLKSVTIGEAQIVSR